MRVPFRKSYEIVGVVGDASIVCLECAREMYGRVQIDSLLTENAPVADREGNDLGVVFLDAALDNQEACMECGVQLEEAEYFI